MRTPTSPPTDGAFWAENAYGEIVRLRYDMHGSMCAPWLMFADAWDDEAPLIDVADILDWDDDYRALKARVSAGLRQEAA